MRRITELDAIRGLAALTVVIYHIKPQAFLLHGMRVDLFLVLSGFVTTSILLRKRAGGSRFLGAFTFRRWLRIWPTYFLALGALVVVNPWLPKPFPMQGLPYYLTFTQNVPLYWSDSPPRFNWYFGHTWTLALEEQFYLIWPALVVLLGRVRLIPVALALVVMSATMRTLGFSWWLLISRCDGFAFGGLLAVIFLDREQVERHRSLLQVSFGVSTLIAIPVVTATTIIAHHGDFQNGMTLWPSLTILTWNVLYFCLIGLVVLNAGHPSLRILRDARLGYLGKVSYGIYLYHSFVLIILWGVGRALHLGEPLWLDVLKVVLTIVVASLSWHWIEQPILTLKERIRYEPAAQPGDPAVQPVTQLGSAGA